MDAQASAPVAQSSDSRIPSPPPAGPETGNRTCRPEPGGSSSRAHCE